jgi:DNA repair photolyase
VENFDRVRAKENALAIIRDELRRKVKTGIIGTGSMSDPYNPFEEKLMLTRHALELINAFGFGVSIATKSPLVTRDIDVLRDIAEHSPVLIKLTITTFDDGLCKKLEPGVPPSSERFNALKVLSAGGIYCGVLLMPVLPLINDTDENALQIVRAAKENGARFVHPAFGVTLRDGQREYLYRKLDEIFPGITPKYIKRFGGQYSCASPRSKQLYRMFAQECDKLGLLYKMRDIIRSYKLGYEDLQMSLFE